MTRPARGQAPSWVGTLIVVIAVIAMMLRAAAELRRSVSPNVTDAPSAAPPSAVPPGSAP